MSKHAVLVFKQVSLVYFTNSWQKKHANNNIEFARKGHEVVRILFVAFIEFKSIVAYKCVAKNSYIDQLI